MRHEIFISYSHKDEKWLTRLKVNLTPLVDRYPLTIWDDTKIKSGERWKDEIERALDSAGIAILLVSQDFLASDFIKERELPRVLEAARKRGLKIFWIAVSSAFYEITEIADYQALNKPDKPLDQLNAADWKRELVEISRKIKHATTTLPTWKLRETIVPVPPEKWETEGGAVPLGSPFYINRPVDDDMYGAIRRGECIIRIKGVRQVGKTSLLARGLRVAHESDVRVVRTDFERLGDSPFGSLADLYLQIARLMAKDLNIDSSVDEIWKDKSPPNINFEDFVRDVVLKKTKLVWALDEVDRLFTHSYKDEFFGLLRSWFNERSNYTNTAWHRCTIILAYATEPQLYIKKINASPFNVGLRIALEDFEREDLLVLNAKYGSPLSTEEDIDAYFKFVGGHPYLIRRGLHYLAKNRNGTGRLDLARFETQAVSREEPFGDHLFKILQLLNQNAELSEAVKGLLVFKRPLPNAETFYRLKSAGIVMGDHAQNAGIRSGVYAEYLRRHLL